MDARLQESMVRRLDQLERQNRQLRRWLLLLPSVALVASVSLWLFGPTPAVAQPAPKVQAEVRAKSFKVVDDNDRVRVVIQFNPGDGASVVDFFDENKSWRGGFSAGKDFSQFVLRDSNDTERYRFQANKDDTYIQINDRTGTKKAVVRPQ